MLQSRSNTESAVNQPCYHCGLASSTPFSAAIHGQQQAFCCMGCQAIALTIHGAGLEQFYQFRQTQSPRADDTVSLVSKAYDSPEFLTEHTLSVDQSPQLKEIHLRIDDIRCAACVWLIENHLRELPGVDSCHVLLGSKRAKLVWNPNSAPLSTVLAALQIIGYKATVVGDGTAESTRSSKDLLRLGIAGFGMMQVGMYSIALYAGAWQGISDDIRLLLRLGSGAVATLVLLVSAWPFFVNALTALRHKHVVMDVPIAVAIGLAYSASVWATLHNSGEVYFDSVTMFTFFILLSRFIEAGVNRRFNEQQQPRAIALTVKRALPEQSYGEACEVSVNELGLGDEIWLAAGQALPVDAQLISATAEFDESIVSGESLPVLRRVNDTVFAGSINGNSVIRLKVTALGQKTRLSRLAQLQFKAESLRPKWASMANQLAAKFVIVVLLLAVATYITWLFIDPNNAFWIALSVLVVSCPCALSLATPTVYTAALSQLRKQGILLRDGRHIERLAKVSDAVFDKTGTLTEGKLQLSQCDLLADLTEQHVLTIAAALEQGAHHPVAAAFTALSANTDTTVNLDEPAHFITGGGVSGIINGNAYILGSSSLIALKTGIGQSKLTAPTNMLSVYLARQENAVWRLVAKFSFSDTIRSEAPATIRQLRSQGIRPAIFSGDNSNAVNTVAESLTITHVNGGMSAHQKLAAIKALQEQQKVVLSVGDGLNDLPFLGGADVSVAVANASDLILQNANINLLRSDLRLLPVLIETSRLAMRRLRQNLAWALAYNSIMIPLAMAGFIAPWLAALGMSLSSLVVVINARRLRLKEYC